MKTTFTLIGILLFFTMNASFAQEIVRSTIGSLGATMSNEQMLVQQTTGQPSATITATNDKGAFVRQGFQQPIYFEALSNELNATIFPNPNSGTFNFQVDLAPGIPFEYTLLDAQGRNILVGKGEGNLLQSVTIDKPTVGMYFLKMVSGNRSSSFKINVIY
jgi:hypothetical protein